MSGFLLDYPYLVMAVVAAVAITVSLFLQRKVHSTTATVAHSVLIIVLVTIPMTDLFARSRDRANERRALRAGHLAQLQEALKKDSEALLDVSYKVAAEGRTTPFNNDERSNDKARKELFYPEPVSTDLPNHFAEYSLQKEKLRTDVAEQDREDKQATLHVMTMLPSHVFQENIARAILWNCRGLGGMTLDVKPNLYAFSWGPGPPHGSVNTAAPREIIEAFDLYKAFRPDAQTSAECQSLQSRAARIVDSARKLGEQAQSLAAIPSLRGDCPYVRLR